VHATGGAWLARAHARRVADRPVVMQPVQYDDIIIRDVAPKRLGLESVRGGSIERQDEDVKNGKKK
jgi:hypothetical protein